MADDLFDVSGTDEAPVIVLRVVAHPGAGRSAVVGIHGDALKIKVGAPPVGGRANRALVELVAELFGVTPAQVVVATGEASRMKRLRIEGVGVDQARHLLDQALSRTGLKSPAGRRSGPPPVQRHL